jgi:hypothetical protein
MTMAIKHNASSSKVKSLLKERRLSVKCNATFLHEKSTQPKVKIRSKQILSKSA